MKRAKKIQKLQKIQGIVPEAKSTEKNKENPSSSGAAEGDLTDSISENFDRFELWFIDNGRKIFAACIAILVIVAAFYTVRHFVEKNRAEVSAKFANADTPEKMQALLDENGKAPEAVPAAFSLAADHAKKKQYDKAIALYTKISRENKDEFLARRAALNVAYLTEIKGQKDSASLLFSRIADDIKAPDGIRAEAAYAAGRLSFGSGDMERARKYLSLFSASQAANREAGQWASLSRALLNRVPASKASAPGKLPAPPVKKVSPAPKAPSPAQKVSSPAPKAPAPAPKKNDAK